jgi:hypothetical protein
MPACHRDGVVATTPPSNKNSNASSPPPLLPKPLMTLLAITAETTCRQPFESKGTEQGKTISPPNYDNKLQRAPPFENLVKEIVSDEPN